MDNTRTQTSEHFAICDILHSRYFKGYYDDGYLIDGYFVTEAARATPFDSINRANNTIAGNKTCCYYIFRNQF